MQHIAQFQRFHGWKISVTALLHSDSTITPPFPLSPLVINSLISVTIVYIFYLNAYDVFIEWKVM
jgi:hypothetical protein